MTAAPQSPLVERVAMAIAASIYRSEGLETMNYAGVEDYCRREWEHYAAEAQAALVACQAERLLATLREYIAAADQCAEGGDDLAAMLRFGAADKAARALLADMEGRP